MKRSVVVFLISLSCAAGVGSAGYAVPASGAVRMPGVKTFVLDNGVSIFYIRDELPQITIIASIGFGRLYEDRHTAGLSELLAKMISLGGSKKYPSASLHELIDSIGGRLAIEASWEHTVISIKVLDRFKKEAFAIMEDLILNPNLEPRYFDMARTLISDSLRRRYEDPAEIAFGKAREIIFGGDGYGSFPTPDTIGSITLEQAREAWRRYYRGRNIMIGIYASLTSAEAAKLCASSFSGIPDGGARDYTQDDRKITRTIRDANGTIFFYPREIPQSTVVMGTVAPAIRYAGKYSLEIMNYVLGGGSFSSRLVADIRVKRGLAYAVQSVIRFRNGTGVFLAYAQTENRNAAEVLAIMRNNIEKLGHERINREELIWAKKAIRNSFVFQFDTPLNIISNYMEIAYNNLPGDYYARYLGHVHAVTDGDIMNEAERMMRNGFITVVVGGRSVLTDLRKHGSVVVIK
jgi:zinc protease